MPDWDHSFRIAIEFDKDLLGDVSGNETAFTITGQEYEHVNGQLIDVEYEVVSVQRPDDGSTEQNIIWLNIDPYTRFNDAVGEITVHYDESLGSLAGDTGRIESFAHLFTPTVLQPIPNPYAEETLTAGYSLSPEMTRIYYKYRYSPYEQLSSSISTVSVELIAVEDIPV